MIECQEDTRCDDGDVCTIDVCNLDSGECQHEPVMCADGSVCESEGDVGCPVCGDGITSTDVGEACDDAGESASCDADCTDALCGDGTLNVAAGEVCDDGNNDDGDGCSADCLVVCGDGIVDTVAGEACDDGNTDETDGCLSDCRIPTSCLALHWFDASLPDGTYAIAPTGYTDAPFDVHCDMTTDGGGYTFLKVAPGVPHKAFEAEATCAAWGMQLWIPRTLDHRNSGWQIANDASIGPDASPDYMRILAIYPAFDGATCASQPMNSDNPGCNWQASDGKPWYVHEVTNISEPNGDNQVGGSMLYQWDTTGEIEWHNDVPDGYASERYMCDVGDMHST